MRRTDRTYGISDIVVISIELAAPFRDQPCVLEIYDQPLPLVIDVWSESTDDYPVDETIQESITCVGRQIIRLHPCERTLTAWRRQPDGQCEKTIDNGGKVESVALPGVVVDLDGRFEWRYESRFRLGIGTAPCSISPR